MLNSWYFSLFHVYLWNKKHRTMSIAETLSPPKEHITAARTMAENIFNYSPAAQIEMIAEIKNQLTKRMEVKLTEIRKS